MLSTALSCLAGVPSYVAVDMGPSNAAQSAQAEGINNVGQIVGGVSLADGESVALVTDVVTGKATRVRTGQTRSYVSSINDEGYMTGSAGDGYRGRAFVSRPGGKNVRFLKSHGADFAFAYGINASRQVVGETLTLDRRGAWKIYAFITDADGGNVRRLAGMDSAARAINDAGQATGHFLVEGERHVFITDAVGVPRDTGIAGDAYAINASGQIAGYLFPSCYNCNYPAFVTGPNGAGMRVLTGIASAYTSMLRGINAHGQVVGEAQVNSEEYFVAIVSDVPATTLYRLDAVTEMPSGLRFQTARSINDAGQIAATGTDGHVYLLTPK